MTERCHTLASDETISSIPWTQDAQQLLLAAPPMLGAEYLSPAMLETTWDLLDQWLCQQVIQNKSNLADYLKKQAPQWRQVGRVCFHLAENTKDTDYPFAFLATYAPDVSPQGKIQYQPLGNALQAYAGARNKKALIHLLSPIQAASESSELIKEQPCPIPNESEGYPISNAK